MTEQPRPMFVARGFAEDLDVYGLVFGTTTRATSQGARPMTKQPKTTEAKCPKCDSGLLLVQTAPAVGQVSCKQCRWEFPFPIDADEVKPSMLHHKAMLVVTDWMAVFEGASGRGPVVSDMDAIENLDCQLKEAFQQDEQIRADLLAVLEWLIQYYHGECNPSESALPKWDAARAVVARVKEGAQCRKWALSLCSLHNAAENLLAASKAALEELERLTDVVGPGAGSVEYDVVRRLRIVIAQAERGT